MGSVARSGKVHRHTGGDARHPGAGRRAGGSAHLSPVRGGPLHGRPPPPAARPGHATSPQSHPLVAPEPGRVHNSAHIAFGCAAAELGELALRHKLRVQPRNSRAPGLDIYPLRGDIQLLDTGRTALVRAGDLLTEPARHSDSGQQAISPHRWLRQHRRAALSRHRRQLVHRDILRHVPGGFFGRERHYPDRLYATR
ncbi:GPP34 family phosphoprotein [Streptomyces nondiastaticus]|uniref:GPP34 family phosphoprotein n=1 Tax=Streptomyces nondiastaticus TaxID=3154512 RepID=A0ABW6U3W6_9ACTN